MSLKITNREIHEKAIAKYGQRIQREIAIEEMSELTQILCKIERITHLDTSIPTNQLHYFAVMKELKPKLISEIVDVSLMMESLRVIYDSDGKLYKEQKDKKLLRLCKRIDNSKEFN